MELKSSKHLVKILPEDVEIQVPSGTALSQVAAMAGIELKSVCDGRGTCGRCAVKVISGSPTLGEGNLSAARRAEGYVLACRSLVAGDLEVEIPAESRLAEHEVLMEDTEERTILTEETLPQAPSYDLKPAVGQHRLTLSEPTLTENASDLARLRAGLSKEAGIQAECTNLDLLQRLPDLLRAGKWQVTARTSPCLPGGADELLDVVSGSDEDLKAYGLAVDIGTTSNVVHLVDLTTGLTVDRAGTYNRQARFGADVITRIIHAVEHDDGLSQLQQAVVGTLSGLISEMTEGNGVNPEDILAVMVAGNTTMAHLFLGIQPRYIRAEPYIPAANEFPMVRAGTLGLPVNPVAPVFTFPAVASYVGGDIVSGVLATGMAESEEISLLIDIGTNGEMVLGNRDWLISCSCSMGPVFEGGGIACGMRAVPGAIQRLRIDPVTYDVKYSTVGGAPVKGVCGSGLIDLLAALHKAEIIDRTGQFQAVSSNRYRKGDNGPEFVLAWGSKEGVGQDIVITEADVKNLMRGKAALYAGIRSMLRSLDLDLDIVENIYIAGGFGNYLHITDAVAIGMLPDIDPDRYRFVGNTSIKGARLALLSRDAWSDALAVAAKMTYLELSAGNTFMDEFMSAMFLPHTDLTLFPNVALS